MDYPLVNSQLDPESIAWFENGFKLVFQPLSEWQGQQVNLPEGSYFGDGLWH